MKAVVFEKPHEVKIKEVADPVPKENEVIVKVKNVGLCGTDVHILEGEYYASYPLIPGHEFSGIITKVGSEVDSFKKGDRVTVDPNLACGACYFCRIGRGNHCLNFQGIGVTRDGAFAEYVAAPAKSVYKIGELGFPEGAMVEPLACAVYGIERVGVALGSDVLIFGAGPMGILLMQLAKRAGAAKVAMTDLKEGRLKLAQSLGADAIVIADEKQEDTLRKIAPLGFDLVIDATGVPAVVERAFGFTKNGGKILFFGVCPRDSEISVSPFEIYKRDLIVYGTFALFQTFEPAISLLQNSALEVKPLISHRFNLSEFEQAIKLMRGPQESMKIQIEI